MKTANSCLGIFAIIVVMSSSAIAQGPMGRSAVDWRAVVQDRLLLYGHRNWIIVADSAFPAYAEPGVETIVVNDDLPTVLDYVAQAISSSRHLRATVFLDQELDFVEERDYPGVSELKKRLASPFQKDQVSMIPHADLLSRINEAGKTFRILFIKTAATIPYTSVYLRLDCGYLSDEVNSKIAAGMSSPEHERPK